MQKNNYAEFLRYPQSIAEHFNIINSMYTTTTTYQQIFKYRLLEVANFQKRLDKRCFGNHADLEVHV